MSQEEAYHRPRTPIERISPAPPAPARPPDDDVAPRFPLFAARTDAAAGTIHTRGHLDRVGAEVLRRIAAALRDAGHDEVVVHLGSTTVAHDLPPFQDGIRLVT